MAILDVENWKKSVFGDILNTQKATYFFVVWAGRRIIHGWSVGKIIIIIMLNFTSGTSKNKKYQSMRFCTEATTSLYSMIQCCQMY